MSVCGGTRRKKIPVLHMLGSWEGRIEGCNCPSCKEWDDGEKSYVATHKSPPKSPKGPRKVGSKVLSPKDFTTISHESETSSISQVSPEHIVLAEGSEHHEEFRDLTEETGQSSESKGSVSASNSQGNCTILDDNVGDPGQEQSEHMSEQSGTEEVTGSGENLEGSMNERHQERIVSENHSAAFNEVETQNKIQTTGDPESDEKQISEEGDRSDTLKIKQEPEEYFSDEETVVKPAKRKYAVCREPRISKRAKMVTSEIENMYAKPRMIFTGRGVVRKFEPCLDRTPKSRRGRKPGKVSMPVKVKQEPKEVELHENEDEEEGGELDQLQRALSEAAENIHDVGEEFFDALNDFGEDSKKGGRPRRRNNALFKRVEGDGDKYVECTMCFKMLKESSMKQHFKTHTGEKPHTCNECDSRFTRKGDVERHKRLVHKNQKPYKCQKCSREFSDRKNLKAHLQNHDKAIYYACTTCGFKFGKREYYENHIRYIHPLPDGTVPQFFDNDIDLATKQLKQIEMEEKQERLANKIAAAETRVVIPDNEDEESKESDKAVEVTLNVDEQNTGSSNSLMVKKEADDNRESQIEVDVQEASTESGKLDEVSRAPVSSLKPEVGTDVSVSKGTLSFTQTVPDTDSQDEELVDKVIAAAVSQATNTIESLQAKSGANLSENDVDMMDEEEEEDEMLEGTDDIQEILDNTNCDMLPIAQVQKQAQQPTEIHINASVSGQQRKFIIQVPPGTNLNVQTPDGMEMIVNIVNQLCAGKGELDGPIEVTMHNPGKRMLMVKKR